MSKTYDAVVIGAGIIGTAVAFELAKNGKRVLGLDMLPAAGYGSTSNSCAIIRVHYSTLDGTAVAYDGYFFWRDWADYLEAPAGEDLAVFNNCGCLVMKTEGNDHLSRIIGHLDTLSIPYEHWDGDRIRQRLPIFDLKCFSPAKRMDQPGFGEPTGGELAGGIYFPTGGYISDPQLATRNIQDAAARKGAEFIFNRRVVEILKQGNRVQGVVLDDGTRIDAPVVINVTGPHSSKVNEMAGVTGDMRITTRALRQEVVHVPAPEGFDMGANGLVISDSDISAYSRPEIGNHILVGSEDPPCDPHDWVDADDFDRNFTDQWTTQAMRQAQRIPTLGIPSRMAGVVDLYDATEDWGPIYDRSNLDGFYMACGSSGNQFKNAQVAGKLMAGLVDYCEAGNDHDATPMPLKLTHLDYTVDTGSFSRRREINQDSSFSVLG